MTREGSKQLLLHGSRGWTSKRQSGGSLTHPPAVKPWPSRLSSATTHSPLSAEWPHSHPQSNIKHVTVRTCNSRERYLQRKAYNVTQRFPDQFALRVPTQRIANKNTTHRFDDAEGAIRLRIANVHAYANQHGGTLPTAPRTVRRTTTVASTASHLPVARLARAVVRNCATRGIIIHYSHPQPGSTSTPSGVTNVPSPTGSDSRNKPSYLRTKGVNGCKHSQWQVSSRNLVPRVRSILARPLTTPRFHLPARSSASPNATLIEEAPTLHHAVVTREGAFAVQQSRSPHTLAITVNVR